MNYLPIYTVTDAACFCVVCCLTPYAGHCILRHSFSVLCPLATVRLYELPVVIRYCKTLNVSVPFTSRTKQNREIKGHEYQLQTKIGQSY